MYQYIRVNSFVVFVSALFAIQSCMKGPGLRKQDGSVFKSDVVTNLHPAEASGQTTGVFDSRSLTTQTLTAGASSGAPGASVSFAPGTLASNATVTIGSASSIASAATLTAAGVSSNISIDSASTAVNISSAQSVAVNGAFSVSIPVAASALRFGLASGFEKYAVIYIGHTTTNDKSYAGVIPRSEITVGVNNSGKDVFTFQTYYFGTFQIVKTSSEITTASKAETTIKDIAKYKESDLPTATWGSTTFAFSSSYKVDAYVSNVTVSNCSVVVSKSMGTPWDFVVASGGISYAGSLSSSLSGTYYAQFQCFDEYGRPQSSPWSGSLAISGSNGGTPNIAINYPILNRKTWVADETYPRTVNFTHDGDSVQCSSDNGNTWGNCTSSTSYEWTVANYTAVHKIKSIKNGVSQEKSFTPSADLPGLNFVNCGISMSGSDTISNLNSNIATYNVVCLDHGTNLTNTSETLAIASANRTIIVRYGSVATLVDSRSAAGGHANAFINLSAVSGTGSVNFVGLDITSSNNSNFYASTIPATAPLNIEDCIIDSTAALTNYENVYIWQSPNVTILSSDISSTNNIGVYVGGNASSNFKISDSVIVATGSPGAHAISMANGVPSFTIEQSTLDSYSSAFDFYSGTTPYNTVGVIDSVIAFGRNISALTTYKLVNLNYTGSASSFITIKNSEFNMYAGPSSYGGIIYLVGNNSGAADGLILDDNDFTRRDSVESAGHALYFNSNPSNQLLVKSNYNRNRFCMETVGFSDTLFLNGDPPQTYFDPAAQFNGGVATTCP